MTTKQLLDEAISLPIEERVAFADSILRTLDTPESGYEEKWIKIARKRLVDIRSGNISPIPGEEVFERIQKRFDE